MQKNFIRLSISMLLFSGCAMTGTLSDTIIKPENLKSTSKVCSEWQTNNYVGLTRLAEIKSPAEIYLNSVGCLDFKDKHYLIIRVKGGTYNSATTTRKDRAANDFIKYYDSAAKKFMNAENLDKLDGIYIQVQSFYYNFLTDEYGINRLTQMLEVGSPVKDVRAYIRGDISDQELLNHSYLFIDARRTKLNLSDY